MPSLSNIVPVVLTFDEEANVGRCLSGLAWAARVVVLDSGSRDGTRAIAEGFDNVEFHERPFDSAAAQWSHAVGLAGDAEWILALDADYVVGEAFTRDVAGRDGDGVSAFEAAFVYAVRGRRLRCGIYPPVKVLFRPGACSYEQDGHTQRLVARGAVRRLTAPLVHDDRKPLERWLSAQLRYARLDAARWHERPLGALRPRERLRCVPFLSPLLVLAWCLTARMAWRDGAHGLLYAGQRLVADAMIDLAIIERRLGSPDG